MPLPEHDPYDDLYGDVPAQEGEAKTETKSEAAADKQASAVIAGEEKKAPRLVEGGQEKKDGESGSASPFESGEAEPQSNGDKQDKDATASAPESAGQAPAEPGVELSTAKAAEGKAPARALADHDPYDDLYADVPNATATAAVDNEDSEGENQYNYVESKEPSELLMCLILASAYLGLAKYCWTPLLLAKDWKLLFNIEGFFLCIATLAILIGLRPYLSPSSLQVSKHGLKYRGPYWPQRKTINWNQVNKLYLSPELIVVLYHPKLGNKSLRPMFIPIVYLSDRERIAKVFIQYSPIYPVILSSPALLSRIVVLLAILGVIIWVLEMLIH